MTQAPCPASFDLSLALDDYRMLYPEEVGAVEKFMSLLADRGRCFERDSFKPGHVTGSAWLVDETGECVLLTHHRKLDAWLQPGGHSDGDPDTAAVAKREAGEESGLEVELLTQQILDIDIHEIPARNSDPVHYHFDVRFAVASRTGSDYIVSDESHDLAWVPIAEIRRFTEDESIIRMAGKWAALRGQIMARPAVDAGERYDLNGAQAMNEHASGPPGDPGDDNQRRSHLSELMKRRPIAFALCFEGALAAVALLLALVFGLRPWLAMNPSAGALGLSVLATLPILAAVTALMQFHWGWVRTLKRIVEDHLLPLFSGAGPLAIFAVALMAGIGEELLFRGVVQAGLEGLIGPAAALVAASLLFGLAHVLTPAYFVLTCLMGLYLGWLYQATGNLLVPIMVHFLYDWIVLAWYLRRAPDAR